MSKKSFYFSHDSNARNDEKILALRMRHRAEGYGVYFMILERLVESTDYTSVKDYNALAFDLRVSAEIIKSIIEEFGLFAFTDDGKRFYSESLLKRMQPLDNIREQRRQAGLKSAEKRAKNNTDNQEVATTVERPLPQNSTKESKVKESKENILLKKESKSFFEKNQSEFENQLKQPIEKRKKVAPKKEKFGKAEFRQFLLECGALEQDIRDWFDVRKIFTKRSLELFVQECEKHQFPVASAVKICADKGWRGFQYSWIKQNSKDERINQPTTTIKKPYSFDLIRATKTLFGQDSGGFSQD